MGVRRKRKRRNMKYILFSIILKQSFGKICLVELENGRDCLAEGIEDLKLRYWDAEKCTVGILEHNCRISIFTTLNYNITVKMSQNNDKNLRKTVYLGKEGV